MNDKKPSAREVSTPPRFGCATVDPRASNRLHYYTFVMQGFLDAAIRIQFRRLDYPNPPDIGIGVEVGERRLWVDTGDRAGIDASAYEWADVFGKVNCTAEDAARHPKLRLLGPVFGVRFWALPYGYAKLLSLTWHGANPRVALAGIRFQGLTRLPISDYQPSQSEGGYVFHRSRAWSGEHAGANGPRKRFIEAVQRTAVRGDVTLADDRMPLSEYLDRTTRSSVAFNCPALHGCLGWKLGEYLALGKAIISTPLGRALPEPLIHGTNIHFVEDEVEAIRAALLLIDGDTDYRRHLERGARQWYERNLTPSALVYRLLAT